IIAMEPINMEKDEIAIDASDDNLESIFKPTELKDAFDELSTDINIGKLFEDESQFAHKKFVNNILLCPYITYDHVDLRNANLHFNNDKARFSFHLNTIENEYNFIFLYLINCVNANTIYKSDNLQSNWYYINSRDQFFNILSISFLKNADETKSIYDLKYLYEEFKKFKVDVLGKYNIEKLRSPNRNKEQYECFSEKKNKNINLKSIHILDLYMNALKSENFNFLFKVFLGFRFMYKIRDIMGIRQKELELIKLLQLIICKFEYFRFSYFNQKEIPFESLDTLISNSQFNETIAVIGILLKYILEVCKLDFNYLKIIEIQSFAFFVAAKYPEIFTESEFFGLIKNNGCSDDGILKQERDSDRNLTHLSFTEDFQIGNFYKMLEEIIMPYDVIFDNDQYLRKYNKKRKFNMKDN
ncbi:hypothetical protein H311_02467, partial [Anncaliia algerae PRA109]